MSALAARDLVIEREEGPSTGGRPPTLLRFNTNAGVVLVAAIGRSRTRLAVCDLAGNIIALTDIDQEIGVGPGDLMADVVKRLEVLLVEAGHTEADIHGVGLSLPGTVDPNAAAAWTHPP